MKHTCPVCSRRSEGRPENPFAPFCSQRCKHIDLARWLDGEYVLDPRSGAVEHRPDDEEGGG